MTKKRISVYALLGRSKKAGASEPLSPLVKRIFTLSFLSEFIAIYPFYVIMFGERGNVSAAGVGLLLGIWMTVSVLAEVPTGIIADKLSKKWALVFGRIMQLLTFSVWLFAPNFTGYLIGFLLWGVGEAFLSGAFQAYLYESLGDASKQSFSRIYSRSSAFTMLAYMCSSTVGFIIGPNYTVLLMLSVLVSSISLGITLGLPTTRSKVMVEVELRPKILASALRAIKDNFSLRRILFMAIIVQGLMLMLGEYMAQYYHQVGTSTRVAALYLGIGSAAAAAMYWGIHHVETQLLRYQALIVAGLTGLFVLSFWGGTTVAVLGMFILTRMLRTMAVNNESHIQHHAPNEARATLGSIYSFASRLLSAALVAIIGFFAIQDKIVVPLRWSVIGMVALLCLGSAYFALRHKARTQVD